MVLYVYTIPETCTCMYIYVTTYVASLLWGVEGCKCSSYRLNVCDTKACLLHFTIVSEGSATTLLLAKSTSKARLQSSLAAFRSPDQST